MSLSINYFCDPQTTALPGGIVLKGFAGKVSGGFEMSGLDAEEDAADARAAAEAINDFDRVSDAVSNKR